MCFIDTADNLQIVTFSLACSILLERQKTFSEEKRILEFGKIELPHHLAQICQCSRHGNSYPDFPVLVPTHRKNVKCELSRFLCLFVFARLDNITVH